MDTWLKIIRSWICSSLPFTGEDRTKVDPHRWGRGATSRASPTKWKTTKRMLSVKTTPTTTTTTTTTATTTTRAWGRGEFSSWTTWRTPPPTGPPSPPSLRLRKFEFFGFLNHYHSGGSKRAREEILLWHPWCRSKHPNFSTLSVQRNEWTSQLRKIFFSTLHCVKEITFFPFPLSPSPPFSPSLREPVIYVLAEFVR